MSFNFTALFVGFVASVIGIYLLKRGKSQGHMPHVAIGLGLMVYPYFVESTIATVGLGLGLLTLAYFFRN